MTAQDRNDDSGSPTLFVSYRRLDAFAADQLVQALQYAVGHDRVIQDTLSFEPATQFPDEIARWVRQCQLMVVLIGPDWCGAAENSLKQREDDWVRREVEIAVASGRPLLPVLLTGAHMPRADQLPQSMLPMLAYGALQLRTGEDSQKDLRRIVAVARKHVSRDWRRVAGEAAFLAVGMGASGVGGAVGAGNFLFPAYAAWQWPNLLVGSALALVLPALAGLAVLSRQWAAKWRRPQAIYRQTPLQCVCLAGVVLAATVLAWPVLDPIDELYASIESTRAEVPRVAQQLRAMQAMPRHAASVDLQLVAHLLAVRGATDLSEDAVNSSVNALAPYMAQADTRRRIWATLMTADAYRFTTKQDQQLALFRQVAQDPGATRWQRWFAWFELGSITHVHTKDPRQARAYYEQALQFLTSRGLLQNLAVLDEDLGEWDSAARRYEQALQFLTDHMRAKKLANLADQEATLYANWCNMRRRQASVQPEKAEPSRAEAITLCGKAIAAYTPHMDAYWNLARVQMDAGDLPAARVTLRNALQKVRDLSKLNDPSLKRFKYDLYAERYTLWLLVATQFLAKEPLSTEKALVADFSRQVVGLEPQAADAVAKLLQQMQANDLTMDEDLALLVRMKSANYLQPS
jgi:tetratricopeptide (TPR) repeat protein